MLSDPILYFFSEKQFRKTYSGNLILILNLTLTLNATLTLSLSLTLTLN